MCDTRVVVPSQVDLFLKKLPEALTAAQPTVALSDKQQFAVALNACSSDTIIRFKADLRIYLEACKYASGRDKPAFFLITEDYKFFRTFIRSKSVEDILRQTACGILGISYCQVGRGDYPTLVNIIVIIWFAFLYTILAIDRYIIYIYIYIYRI